jgi:5-methylcytosine-specific restriction endonuclease McrA
VLVLNATYEPINVCTVRRAAVLLLKQKAEVIENASWALRSEHTTLPRPMVIRLVAYVKVPRDAHRRKITRRAVFARDGWTCQYCGARSNLTVDHVIPRSKGGSSEWDNIVASCAPCNRRKGDLLPEKANMIPRVTPRVPHPQVFIHVASPTIPASWKQWLPETTHDVIPPDSTIAEAA